MRDASLPAIPSSSDRSDDAFIAARGILQRAGRIYGISQNIAALFLREPGGRPLGRAWLQPRFLRGGTESPARDEIPPSVGNRSRAIFCEIQ